MVIALCVAGSQDTDDHLHTKRDLWPRTHHQTLPVRMFSSLFHCWVELNPLLMFGSCDKESLTMFFANTCTSTISPPSFWCPEVLFPPFTSEAYPSCTVTDIRFCFNVHKLMRLDLERYSNCYRLEQRSLWSVWDCCLRMLMSFAGAKRWKAGCILLQRPKRRGRSWSRPIRVLRYSAATSAALKRCFF